MSKRELTSAQVEAKKRIKYFRNNAHSMLPNEYLEAKKQLEADKCLVGEIVVKLDKDEIES